MARNHTQLAGADLDHLQRLMSVWGMLSDLCFADLLLFVPLAGSQGARFVMLGQARPTTSQTFHLDVLVGRVVDEFERPMVARAWRRNEIVETDDVILGRGERARVQCIPVVRDEEPVAVLSRESPLTVGRRPGQLERVYIETFQRLALMIAARSVSVSGRDGRQRGASHRRRMFRPRRRPQSYVRFTQRNERHASHGLSVQCHGLTPRRHRLAGLIDQAGVRHG